MLASLEHPHIAAVHGFTREGDLRALVMELVDGPTLEERMAAGAIPLHYALPIARQIAEALQAAHEKRIVHRDLKPANIKVRADGTVKVLDFGLARALQSGAADDVDEPHASATVTAPDVTQAGAMLGTAAYMSPEQARGEAVDQRTDLWAFGAVLYEMLTGCRRSRVRDHACRCRPAARLARHGRRTAGRSTGWLVDPWPGESGGYRTLMAVDVAGGAAPVAGLPREVRRHDAAQGCYPVRCYDISSDGRRFLFHDDWDRGPSIDHVELILDWVSTLPTAR